MGHWLGCNSTFDANLVNSTPNSLEQAFKISVITPTTWAGDKPKQAKLAQRAKKVKVRFKPLLRQAFSNLAE